jgi:hypothetical protein
MPGLVSQWNLPLVAQASEITEKDLLAADKR